MAAKKYNQTDEPLHVLQEPSAGLAYNDYFQMASAGISKKYIKDVIKRAKISVGEMIQILPMSLDTYKRKSTFNTHITEKVLEIEEVYNKGLAAFGESFYDWMDTPNIALGNIRPKALLNNSFGIRILLDEIGRLEHGVLA